MENKILAIKGHPTRGKEVIEILEMLGGKNIKCTGTDESLIYTISSCDGFIKQISFDTYHREYKTFTLEEFLEKYPYKVGDKCKYIGHIYSLRQRKFVTLSRMSYMNNTIEYRIEKGVWVEAKDLQPYEEEIKAEDRLKIYADPAIDNDSKTDIIINGEKLIAPNGYTVKNATTDGDCLIVEYIKNKPQYPKTYPECCRITKKVAKTTHELDIAYNPSLIYDFQKLLICRDAYWKIAGTEMGLSEPWKPNFGENYIYAIGTFNGTIEKRMVIGGGILLFPAEEMRDAFFENFKDLIEECKEFL